MTIQFNDIPGNIRVPLWYAEINPAQTPYQSNARLLLVGQRITAGTATAGEPVMIVSDPEALFGSNSMLTAMYYAARANAPFQEIWALPLDDDAAGVAATATITIGNIASILSAQTVGVWIGDVHVRCIAYATDTTATLATRLAAAITLAITEKRLVLASATASGAVITLTAKHKGLAGNSLRIEPVYRPGENPTSAKIMTVVQFSGGDGDPDITSALAALGDDEFDWIVSPYADTDNLGAASNFLNGASGRWSPMQQLYGHYATAKSDTVANLATFGLTLNDPHLTVLGVYKYQSPLWSIVGALGGRMAAHLQDAPELSRPLQSLQLIGILPPKAKGDRFNITSRNSLYYDGISGLSVDKAGAVRIDRIITTYRTNVWGGPDASWLDVNTLAQNMYAIRYLKAKVTGTWGRAALADENPLGVQGLATPMAVRDTILHGYQELVDLAVVENFDLFSQVLIVERNKVDANRLDIYLPADQVNQLRIIATNYVSHLQYPAAMAA